MSQIKQLLRLYQNGWKIKAISRELQLSRNTVKRYLQQTQGNGWDIAELLELADPELEARLHQGHLPSKDARFEQLSSRLAYYAGELKRTGVTQDLLWQEYKAEHPKGYGRSQFCYHLSRYVNSRRPTMVLTHRPAEKLFIDFAGKKLSYVDRQTGEIIYCQVFVACLPYSDYGYAIAISTQNITDFLYALRCCLEALGGCTQLIVPDNFKAAITRASRYEPDVNQALEDFANHYGCSILPARVRKPRDKALVEDHVKLLYTRVYAPLRNRQFFSLSELNAAIAEKVEQHVEMPMQEKPLSRQDCFFTEEKPHLLPLPEEPFELKYYRRYTVRQNNHIKLCQDTHYYSVPYTYIGQRVRVIYTRTMVRIYAHGKQIATHRRDCRPGRYSTEEKHLCSHHRHYLNRSPDYYLAKARSQSPTLYQLTELIFKQPRHPEQLYGTCDGLLHIHRKMGAERADKAFQMAIDLKNYSYRFVLNVLENNMIEQHQDKAEDKPLPPHDNIRGKGAYQ